MLVTVFLLNKQNYSTKQIETFVRMAAILGLEV